MFKLMDARSRLTGRALEVYISPGSNKKVGAAAGIVVVSADVAAAIKGGSRLQRGADWFRAHRPGSNGLADACGPCALGASGKCYVQGNVQAASQPAAIVSGNATRLEVVTALRRHRVVRSAIAGDVAALMPEDFAKLREFIEQHGARAWLGYTHDHSAVHLQGTHVASCDDHESALAAKANGWRTFEVIAPKSARVEGGVVRLNRGEFLCPASKPAMGVRQASFSCSSCMACTGTDRLRPNQPTAVVLRHGPGDTRSWTSNGGTTVIDHNGRTVGVVK